MHTGLIPFLNGFSTFLKQIPDAVFASCSLKSGSISIKIRGLKMPFEHQVFSHLIQREWSDVTMPLSGRPEKPLIARLRSAFYLTVHPEFQQNTANEKLTLSQSA